MGVIRLALATSLASDALRCFVRYLCYILPFAGSLMVLRQIVPMPREVFRKLLHVAAFSSTPVIMWLSGSWQVSVLVMVAMGVVFWPLLALFENRPWFASLLVQRRTHEVRRSLLILFWGNAAVVALCWGACHRPDIAVASVLMWGFGDGAAALVGKRWGRHHTGLPLADPKKTWEGTGAMLAISWVAGVVTLSVAGRPLAACMVRAAVTALVGAYVELITRRGNDTITVPMSNAAVLLALSAIS